MAETSETSRVNSVLREVLRSVGVAEPIMVRDVLTYPALLLDCVPETDPYGPRMDGVYAPFLSRAATDPVPIWPLTSSAKASFRVFVYMRDERVLPSLLDFLLSVDAAVLCFWPGYAPNMYSLQAPGLAIHTSPVGLAHVFEQASLIVGYGSVGISTRAVLAGLPQLVFPTDVEKLMVGRRIQQQGLGVCLEPGWNIHQLRQAYERIRLADERFARSAAAAAAPVGLLDYFDGIRSFVDGA